MSSFPSVLTYLGQRFQSWNKCFDLVCVIEPFLEKGIKLAKQSYMYIYSLIFMPTMSCVFVSFLCHGLFL